MEATKAADVISRQAALRAAPVRDEQLGSDHTGRRYWLLTHDPARLIT